MSLLFTKCFTKSVYTKFFELTLQKGKPKPQEAMKTYCSWNHQQTNSEETDKT